MIETNHSTKLSSGRWVAAAIVWMVATTLGLFVLISYSNTSGDVGVTPVELPSIPTIRNTNGTSTLLMFIHPQCPCSQASLEQLTRIHARCHNKVTIRILFRSASESPDTWVQTRLWKSAQRIPGAIVTIDPDGRTAAKFGARTSGHVLVYNADGKLVFNGGITAARGHEGDSLGTSAVIACLREGVSIQENVPVFGCDLHSTLKPRGKQVCSQPVTPQAGVSK